MVGGSDALLDDWRLVRRYAVPAWMIAECAAARERGDWRAACAAARVTVAFADPGPVADLLAGFAPDLLRWHLPRARAGTAALATELRFVLAPDGPVTADTVVLGVRTPGWVNGAQRLSLHAVRAGDMAAGPVFPLPPHLWDARRAGGLRAAAHGSADRLPGFTPGGDPLPGDDQTGSVLRPRGVTQAWAAAGWSVHETDPDGWSQVQLCNRPAPAPDVLSRREFDVLRGVDPVLAARELRRVAAQFGHPSWELWAAHPRRRFRRSEYQVRASVEGEALQLARRPAGRARPGPLRADLCLHPALLRVPVDLELLRHGLIGVEHLHPLVRAALFPAARPAESGPARADPVAALPSLIPAGFAEGERVRVRCGAEWHWIAVRGGRFALLHPHTDAERRRERALHAFGGSVNGCFKAEMAWHEGVGAVPRRLRTHRRELWRLMRHGGARVVLALLDAGMDPHIRDGQGRTLLHLLHQFEHAELLPRLLAAGVDVNARSRRGHTPMCEALVHAAPAGLLMALNDAGAHPPLSLPDPRDWPAAVDAGDAEAGQLRG